MSLHDMKVMFVEDDTQTKEAIKFFLQDEVKELYLASNGQEGLELFEQLKPDIVITDENMPIMCGLEMIEKIKVQKPNQSVVLFTAKSDVEILTHAIDVNINKIVLKPVKDFEVFLSKLEELSQNIITQKRIKEKEYLEEEKRKILSDYVLWSTSDLEGNVTDISSAFLKLSGYGKEEVIGQNHNIFRRSDYSKKSFKESWKILDNGEKWEGELENQTKDGQVYWISTIITPFCNENGEKIGYKSIKMDITDKKHIESLSEHDNLTKLFNRRKIAQYLVEYKEKVDRYNIDCSVVMIDIDDFKLINDHLGHVVGDKILEEFGGLLSKNVRKTDIVSRWGGEEFVILLPYLDLKQGFLSAKKLRELIENHTFYNNIKITSSFGVSVLSSIKTYMQTIDQADKAMYQSKNSGKNLVTIYSKESYGNSFTMVQEIINEQSSGALI